MARLTNIPARNKILLGVAAAFTLAAIFLLVEPIMISGQIPEALDLTAPVEAENCVPCHTQLGEAKKPGLIFTHGNHIMVSCTACHYRPAHQDGNTFTPPMESCFNCHGVAHGPAGELAVAECEACHTPSFDLRPNSHTEDWVETPHADRAKADTNQCMMCHDAPVDCDQCHEEEGIDVGPMPNTFLGIMPGQLEQPAVLVYPQEPTSMGQCIYCHPDIDDFVGGRVIFAHADHLRRNYDCEVCHPDFGHGIEEIRRPDMLSCYRCHGLTHAAAGDVATEECLDCHPSDFELKPPDHTPEFEAGEHKNRATDEPEYCAMCHEPDFCVECHQGRRPSGPGSSPVIPADHTNADWLSAHGGLYLEQKGACGSCHDSESCKRCHKTVMPHPPDWLEDHAPAGDADRDDCGVCHTDRDSCQNCHHGEVKRAELLEENCVPCHDEMSPKPATDIQNKGYAEHAVHFNVHESKGKPYKCYDCHVSFGSSEAAQEIAKLQGHDLRLCYDCHGAADVFDVEIAPYPGKELCIRCHTDVGV
jgi:hypothetical protein